MLEQLIAFTNSEEYILHYHIWTTEVHFINRGSALKIVLELFNEDDMENSKQVWELTCDDHWDSKGAEQYKRPFNRIKLYNEHPALWAFEDEQYFSITSQCNNIPALMGDLYMAHKEACGNWIDFHNEFQSLPETLATGRSNMLSASVRLLDVYFRVFDKYGVTYRKHGLHSENRNYSLLLFSNPGISPDLFYFNQPYIIAGNFSAKKLP